MARSQTASMPIEVLQTTRPSTFIALVLRLVVSRCWFGGRESKVAWGIICKNAARPSMARSQTASMPIEVLQTTLPYTFIALVLR